jgi:hypothetical protein
MRMMVVVFALYMKVEVAVVAVAVAVEAFHSFVFVEVACTFVVDLVNSSLIVVVVFVDFFVVLMLEVFVDKMPKIN